MVVLRKNSSARESASFRTMTRGLPARTFRHGCLQASDRDGPPGLQTIAYRRNTPRRGLELLLTAEGVPLPEVKTNSCEEAFVAIVFALQSVILASI